MSDSIPLITRLNKKGYKYEYIKLSDLQIDKKYKVNSFEIINTNHGDRVSVILNNKYKLNLPDKYLNIISQYLYEINDRQYSEWYIYYRSEKKLDDGNVYYRIEFVADNEDQLPDNLLDRLNTEDYKYVKLSDLNINEQYKITTFKKITTKYGDQLCVLLDNRYKLFLPQRFVNCISEQDIDSYNGEMFIIYKGKKNLNNGKSVHLIEFE